MALCQKAGWAVYTVPNPYIKKNQLGPYTFNGESIPADRCLRSAIPTVLEIECDDLQKLPPQFKERWNELIINRLTSLDWDFQQTSHKGKSDYFRIILDGAINLTAEQITQVKTNLTRHITLGIGYDSAHIKYMESEKSNPRWTMLENRAHYKHEHNKTPHKIIQSFKSGRPVSVREFLQPIIKKKCEHVFQVPFTRIVGSGDKEDTSFKRYLMGDLYMTNEGIQKSSSEATQSLLNTLLRFNFNDMEIINIMDFSFNAHWHKYNITQKMNEIDRAKEFVTQIRKEYGKERPAKARKTVDDDPRTPGFNLVRDVEKFIRQQPVYYDEGKNWWIWSNKLKQWERKDAVDLMNVIDPNMENHYLLVPQIKRKVLDALQRLARLNKPQAPPMSWIQFNDKIIDIHTNRTFEPSPEYFFTNPIPWDLGTSEDTPILDKLFEDWVGADRAIDLYEMIAYCMLPAYPIHTIFCMLGIGSNGKGTFMDILETFIDKKNCVSSSFTKLATYQFEVANLYKKLICTISETSQGVLKGTDVIKKLCGGDTVGFEFKGKQTVYGKNTAKLIIASNELPKTNDKSDGFYRRWKIIAWENQFDQSVDAYALVTDEEYRNLARKSVKILSNLVKRRKFTNYETIAQQMKLYEDRSDPVQQFISEQCIEGPDEYIEKHTFAKHFGQWLVDMKYKKTRLSPHKITKMMKPHFEETRKDYLIDDKWRPRKVWDGLRLRSSNEHLPKPFINKEQQIPLIPTSTHFSSQSSCIVKLTRKQPKSGISGIDENSQLSDEKIHHPCKFCDLKFSHGWSRTGKPICNLCSVNETLMNQ